MNTSKNTPMNSLKRVVRWASRWRATLLLGVALVFGGLAVFGARGYLAREIAVARDQLQPRQEMVELVVAKRALQPGEQISTASMAVRAIPREFAVGGAIAPDEFEALAGQRVAVSMRSGEPLTRQAIAGAQTAQLSTRLKDGVRAITLAVDEINSVSGLLQPGDRIDLLLSTRPPAAPGGIPPNEQTFPLVQDLEVLATGKQQRAAVEEGPHGRSFTAITVQVTPDQAQRLVVAQRSGKLTAVLRNREDRARMPAKATDISGLIDGPRAAAVPAALAIGPEMIVGGQGPLKPQPIQKVEPTQAAK